jgi:hypothetical protein
MGTVVLCGCTPSEPPPPPKISLAETSYDFGRVAQGAPVSHTYAFHNAGGLDLTIDNVHASCGCTVATPSSRVLHPGDDGGIAVTFDTSRDVGRKTHTLTVYSNDPAQPVTTLSLRIAIKPDAPPGRFKDTVTVRTSSPRQPTLAIPVVGFVDAASGPAAERPE